MKRLIGSSIAAVALMLSAPAFSASIICPDGGTDRTVTVTTDTGTYTGNLECGLSGSGSQNELMTAYEGAGYTEIDKVEGADGTGSAGLLEVTGIEGTSGTFAINPFVEGGAVLVFKFGGGGGDPDWIGVVFLSEINSKVTGTWSTNLTQELSNITLWGNGTSVPEPGTMALLGAGLLGLAALRRRRNA